MADNVIRAAISIATRTLNFSQNFTPPPNYLFDVSSGNSLTLALGDAIKLSHEANSERPGPQGRLVCSSKAGATSRRSERFLRQSVATGINSMSYQRADAQNEARSYNGSRKHERSPRSKSIKEDEHTHSQKNFGCRTRFDRDRCALATATCLQHPERCSQCDARKHHGKDLIFGTAVPA